MVVTIVGRLQLWLVDLFFPRRCVGCGDVDSWVCEKCVVEATREVVPEIMASNSVSAVVALLDFGKPVVRELLHHLKYNGIYEASASLLDLVKRQVSREEVHGYFGKDAVLVPVPTSKLKLKERGYNQAGLLAKELGNWLDLPVVDALVSTKKKQSQVGKGLAERAQLRGRFAVNMDSLPALEGKVIILVDDVFTTGSTIRACAEVLREHDVSKLGAMVLAHKRA